MKIMHKSILLAGAAFIATTSSAAWAQQAPPTPVEAEAQDDSELAEIVVTGDRKGTEVVQVGSFRGATQLDTPLTISVIPRDLIDTQQASQMSDVLRNSPGVTLSQTSPTVYSNVAIRGILTENRTNYRMDGFLPVVNLIDMAIEDKERVEALKGASAIYFGFSPPSGIINMVMKRPTQDWMLSARAFGNSHGRVGGHIDVGNTHGIFGYRINAVYDEPDSGINFTHGKRTVLAGAFDIKPTDNLTIQINAEHLFKKLNEPGVWRLLLPTTAAPGTRANLLPTQRNPNPVIPLPPLLDPNTNFGPDWAENRADETNAMVKAIYKIGANFEITAAAGFSNLRRDRHFNTLDWTQFNTNPLRGGVGENILTQLSTQIASRVQNKNYRLEAAGAFDTGPLRHELLVGVAYLDRKNIGSNPTSINITCIYNNTTGALVGTILPSVGTSFLGQTAPTGTTASSCTQNPLNPHSIPEPQIDMVPNDFALATFKDLGIYAFDRIKIGDWLQVLGGIRYTNYRQTTDSRVLNTVTGVITNAAQVKYTAKPFTFSGGVIIKPIRAISIYGTYLEGIEPAPTPGNQAVNLNDSFPPAESTQFELGFKWQIQRGLLFQSAAFTIDRPFYLLNAQNIFGRDGSSRYRGIELSLNGSITPELSIYSSALFLDAKQTSGAATVVSTILSPDGSFFITPSTIGNRIENTAKLTANMTLNYEFRGALDGLSVSGGAFHTGNQPINPLNSNFIKAVTTFDAGAGYVFNRDTVPITLRVNIENIGNKKYFISTGSNVVAQAPPSTIKFSVGVDF
ncbi:TonB-dependent receptor [Sphingomonas sp.]|jgi:iron complex outermembrane receptor protein|uniref:TonB-dependent siderophore receptor n=1 Tax=Sphingomonas sp. TaxID=28214 RepID=UPI002ED8EA9C